MSKLAGKLLAAALAAVLVTSYAAGSADAGDLPQADPYWCC